MTERRPQTHQITEVINTAAWTCAPILCWKVGRCNPYNHSTSYRLRKETENWVTSDARISQDYMQHVGGEYSKRKINMADTELF